MRALEKMKYVEASAFTQIILPYIHIFQNIVKKNTAKCCRLITSTADSARRDHLLLPRHDFYSLRDYDGDGDDSGGDDQI